MCELLGMNFNRPVNFEWSFKGFSSRGEDNKDGWGIATYPNGGPAAHILKEPYRMDESRLAGHIREQGLEQTKLVLSHVRYASSGSGSNVDSNLNQRTFIPKVSHANTHPFSRVCRGVEYVFAHNGTLRSYERALPLKSFLPIGTTDSEHAFCYVMQKIEAHPEFQGKDLYEYLQGVMQEINRFGKFNALLSDGDRLYAYRDKEGYRGLHVLQRKAPHTRAVTFVDDDFQVNLRVSKSAEEYGFLVATQPLTDEPWEALAPGCLSVYQDGEHVYPLNEKLLSEEKLTHILHCMRNSEHSVTLWEILNRVGQRIENKEKLCREMIESGFIKLDSRDAEHPYEPSARYYTERNRREEIDNRLAQDKLNSTVPQIEPGMAELVDGQTFQICFRCLHAQCKGSTYCRKCGYDAHDIDASIAWSVMELNRKGYTTKYCCSGHDQRNDDVYVAFISDHHEIPAPEGFYWDKHAGEYSLHLVRAQTRRVRGKVISVPETSPRDQHLKRLQSLRALEKWVMALDIYTASNT